MRKFMLLFVFILIGSGSLYASVIDIVSTQYFATVTLYDLVDETKILCSDTEQGGVPVKANCGFDPSANTLLSSLGPSGGDLFTQVSVGNPARATATATMDFYADSPLQLNLTTTFLNSGGVGNIVQLTDLTDNIVLLKNFGTNGSSSFSLSPSIEYQLEASSDVFNVTDAGSAHVNFSGPGFTTPEASSLALLLPCLAVLGIAPSKLRT